MYTLSEHEKYARDHICQVQETLGGVMYCVAPYEYRNNCDYDCRDVIHRGPGVHFKEVGALTYFTLCEYSLSEHKTDTSVHICKYQEILQGLM